jgi:hypothetical protein
MKRLLYFIGSLFIVLSILFFLYGSVKNYRASQEKSEVIVLKDGTEATVRNPKEEMAEYSFTTSIVMGAVGVVAFVLAASFAKKRR